MQLSSGVEGLDVAEYPPILSQMKIL